MTWGSHGPKIDGNEKLNFKKIYKKLHVGIPIRIHKKLKIDKDSDTHSKITKFNLDLIKTPGH